MPATLLLKGKLIVLTRSAEGSAPWKKYLEKQGAKVYFFPTIEIVPVKLTPKIKNTLKNIADFDWVVFTSAAGVRSKEELAKKLKINVSTAQMPKVAVLGDATAAAASAMGYKAAFQPSTPGSAALAFELEPVRGRSVLLLRSALAARDMHDVLTARGAHVTDLAIYKTLYRRDPDPKFLKLLESGRIDFLTFASPSAVRGFFQRLRFQKKFIERARVLPTLAIGPSVAVILKKAGFKNIRVAEVPGIEGISETVKK